MAGRWRPLASSRQMADFFLNARERRKSLFDPSFELSRTHYWVPDATGIATGDLFPDRSIPITIATKVRVTGASPAGIILELGSATTGLAIWIAAADGTIRAAAGDAVADDGVTLTGPAVVSTRTIRIAFSVIPASGKARLWVDGHLEAAGEAANGSFPNGWADTGAGAVAAVQTDVTTRVAAGDRISLTDAQVVSLVSAYNNQRPRQFNKVV